MAYRRDTRSVPAKRNRILVVDDHPLIRRALTDVLRCEPDLEVCGEAASHQEALQALQALRPDLITVDLSLGTSHGLELIKDVRLRFPEVRVLVVTVHDGALNAECALRAGASGFVTKQEAVTALVEAVRAVLRGEFVLSPQLALQLGAGMVGQRSHALLSDRELEVFELLGDGLDRNQIAQRLQLDVNTVETYRARIKQKLHLKDAHELLQHAIRSQRGLGPPSPAHRGLPPGPPRAGER